MPLRHARPLLLVIGLLLTLTAVPAQADVLTPIVFVHGHQGSAQQWQSNAKRFSGNGYPDHLVHAFEYDTSVPTNDRAIAELDAFLADVRARTRSSTVDVIAHSRGTTVVHAYLATGATGVRRYVNVDGRSSATLPGGVPTLALWGSAQPNGSIGGATNVYLTSLGHTETTTSAAGFAHMYRFLRGRDARTTLVLPEPLVRIAGRVTFFPQNEGVPGVLRLWEVREGARVGVPRTMTTADGSFGPLLVDSGTHYEVEFVRDGELTHHFYFEPFERSDRFLRLQVSKPGGIGDQVDRCPTHTAVTVVRNREWWSGEDRLEYDGVDVLAPSAAPKLRQVLAAFAFDDGCDGVSAPGVALPAFTGLPFLTATDTYLPTTPAASIRVTEHARGTDGSRTVVVRNWPSDAHAVTVQFKDYLDLRHT
ncbi:alpha/beta fold hydrolase [Saccharothrix variisporea]|uniref:Lipase (Class 2) n=1 Tax=Saccharothrix variisporea TaxID=543527 RepID=A0A495X0X9_9PSEU|nr:alpha/beta fold hydrolase [Saccharothrix variisporea]RKT67146.1 lipase (class 2) [Saccharothrix variisporea]